jgi:hypothetical protein
MNNAFLFRYRDYTRLYPLAVSALRAAGSLRRAMRCYRRAGREGAVRALREMAAAR